MMPCSSPAPAPVFPNTPKPCASSTNNRKTNRCRRGETVPYIFHRNPAAKMGKFIKSGRVVIMLNGRMAGKKAVVVKTFDEGSKNRAFGHALVAGVQKAPLKVTKAMSKKKQQKRLRVKPFVKYVNYTHMMPTRYSISSTDTSFEAKNMVTDVQMDSASGRTEAKKALAGLFKEKFVQPASATDKNNSGKATVLFLKRKLRF